MSRRLNTRWIGEEQIDPVLRHANYYEAPASGGFGPRYIQEFQILCVHEGRALLTLDERTLEIQPGDVVFYGPHQQHQVIGVTDFKLTGFVLLFRREDTQKLAPDLPHSRRESYDYALGPPICPVSPAPPSLVRMGNTSQVTRFAQATVEAYIDGNQLEAQGWLLLLLNSWLRAAGLAPYIASLTSRQREIVEAALLELRSNLITPPSSQALARKATLSPRHFNRLFERYTGQSPRAFVEHLRLEEARRMLLTSSLTIDAIAQSVGYVDPFYFSRRFRIHFGTPPSEVRRQGRGI